LIKEYKKKLKELNETKCITTTEYATALGRAEGLIAGLIWELERMENMNKILRIYLEANKDLNKLLEELNLEEMED